MNKPWMTRSIYEAIYDRNQYMYDYCAGGFTDLNLLELAKQTRRDINAMTRCAEEHYFIDKLEEHEKNPSKFWKELNELLGRTGKTKPELILNHHVTGEEIKGADVPEYINSFFTGIGESLFNSLGNKPVVSNVNKPSSNRYKPTNDTMVCYSKIIKLLNDIDVHKSSGVDNISAAVMKDALLIMAPQLTSLINDCLHGIAFPKAWSSATVIPLPKSGNDREIGNWRPISLLPMPSKIMERVVYEEIYNRLEENSLISDCQFGFRASRGTNDAVFTLVNDIFNSRDNRDPLVACFLDVRKAFDCIHHSELLSRMKEFNLPNIYCDWLYAYLRNRTQRVMCNNTKSGLANINFGVPQGSI